MNQQLVKLEKTYLDSVFVISHSSQTLRSYKTAINRLRKFLETEYQISELDLPTLLEQQKYDICQIFKEFVVYLDKMSLSPRTIRLTITVVKGYLRHLGIKIDSDDLKQLVKTPKIVKHREIPLDKDKILRLLRNAKPKLQLAILIAVSTGMRIGELAQLQVSDIDFTQTPAKVYIRAETTKTRQSRECFLTTEATKALKDYLIRYHKWNENSPNSDIRIFGPVYRHRDNFNAESAVQMLQVDIRDVASKLPELDTKNENGRASIHFHAFRKYFRTTVGNVCGRDFAEALMGHGFYMDTYYQLSEDKKKDSTITGFNIGINDSADAGQTIPHCHIHLIPRRKGDVDNPIGGMRNIIPGKGNYFQNS